jgi:hypothetical protein
MLQLQELSDALDEIEVESRRDSKLLKIKKALDADYKKDLLKNVDKDEVNLLKLYFNRIINGSNLTISEVTPILDEYIEESNEPYSQIVEGMKADLISNKISFDEFFGFIKKFVDQSYPIDIFYKTFLKRSPYPIPIPPPQLNSSPRDLSDSEDEESKLQKVRDRIKEKITQQEQIRRRVVLVDNVPIPSPIPPPQPNPSPNKTQPHVVSLTDLFGDELEDLSSDSEDEDEESKLQKVEDRIEEKITHQEQRRGRVVLVDDVPIPRPRVPEPKPIADRIFFETMTDLTKQDCEFFYKKIPWVKDIINNLYVHPIEGNFDDIIDFEKFIEHDNIKFYQPKEKYYLIQCHSHKIQDGNVLTIVKNGETYKLMVAIDTNTKGIVLQNEDMLKAEIDYVRVWNQNKNDHIKDLRRNEPDEDMIFLSKFDLSNALQDAISGNVPIEYRSNNSQFIDIVVRTIRKNSNSGDSFVRLLANLIIFLKINLSFITSSVFIKRLREQIYMPGTLPFLTDADKLPEIFLVKNVPNDTQNFVLEKLEEERLRFTKNFF